MNKRNYLILPALFIILVEFILAVPSFSGTVETRISSSTLQSFIENNFPVKFTTDAKILGNTKIPINVKLTNPRLALLPQPAGLKKPFLKLTMDCDISSISEIQDSVQGQISGDLDIAVSQDQESLIISPRESYLPLLPSLKIPLQTMLKPVRLPLFKGLPVKMNGYEVYAKFSNILISVADDYLIINSEVTFEKKSVNENAAPPNTGQHGIR